MERGEEDVRVFLEGVLGPVPVVHVPVQDRDALHAGGAGNPCGGGQSDGWCPDDRVDGPTAPTMIGVHIDYTHARVTQYLPGVSEAISTHAVARLEPSA